MEVDTNWNVEKYKTKFEPEEHWNLKKQFMNANKSKIPESRLICLAQVFANIEILGCNYPVKVMKQIQILSKDIGQEYKVKRENFLKRTFVQASDAANSKVTGSKRQCIRPESENHCNPLKAKIGVKKSCTDHLQKDHESSAVAELASIPKKKEENEIDVESPPAVAEPASLLKKKEENEIDVESPPAVAKPASIPKKKKKKQGKEIDVKSTPAVAEPACTPKEKNKNEGNSTNGESLPRSLGLPVISSEERKKNKDFGDFVNLVIMFKMSRSVTLFHVLNLNLRRAGYLMSIQYIGNSCIMIVTHQNGGPTHMFETSSVDLKGRSKARIEVAAKALSILLEKCYTIREIKPYSLNADEVALPEVDVPDVLIVPDSLDDNSIGAKLLKSMGWSGGALGKRGDGITEPIILQQKIGRQGVGTKQKGVGSKCQKPNGLVMAKFIKNVKPLLNNLLISSNISELPFSSELSNEERKYIHRFVTKCYKKQLKAISHTTQDGSRKLVVTKVLPPEELLQKIQENSDFGKGRYEFYPPGSLTLEAFDRLIYS